jgi:hypothetical protein
LQKNVEENVEILLAIFNIAGKGQSFYGSSNGSVNTALWIIPKGKKNRKEVIEQLQAIQSIREISVVTLNNPVEETELEEVRELFVCAGLDTSEVTDNELSLFLNAKLQEQYTYFIDFDHDQIRKGIVKIHIKPIEEHPNFSPDWLKKDNDLKEELQDKTYTIDDIKIQQVTIQDIKQEEERKIKPPPPPPPPNNEQ